MFDTIINIYETALFTIFLYVSCSHKNRYAKYISFIYFTIEFCFIQFINESSTSAGFLELVEVLITYLFISFISNEHPIKKIVIAITPFLLLGLTNIPFLLTLNTMFFRSMDYYDMLAEYYVPIILFIQILHTVLLYLISRVMKDIRFEFSASESVLIFLSLLICEVLTLCIESVMLQNVYHQYYLLLAIYGVVFLTFCLIRLFILIHSHIMQEAQDQMELKMMHSELASSEKILEMQKDLYKMRHDLKHYFELVNDPDQEEKKDLLLKYKKQFEETAAPIITLIPAFDYALEHARKRARQNGINLLLKINITETSNIKDSDLYLLLSNLFDNALQHMGTAGNMSITAKTVSASFNVKVCNSIDSRIIDEEGNLINETELLGHGFGLRTIREIIRKYDGLLLFSQENNEFCVIANLPLDGIVRQ